MEIALTTEKFVMFGVNELEIQISIQWFQLKGKPNETTHFYNTFSYFL